MAQVFLGSPLLALPRCRIPMRPNLYIPLLSPSPLFLLSLYLLQVLFNHFGLIVTIFLPSSSSFSPFSAFLSCSGSKSDDEK